MTEREAAIKKITDAGGTWPPKMARMTPWRDTGRYESLPCRGCGQPVRHGAALVSGLWSEVAAMRPVKVAIAAALRTRSRGYRRLVPAARASTRPSGPRSRQLPSIEVIGLSSERAGDGPMVKHELSIEVTMSHPNRGRAR